MLYFYTGEHENVLFVVQLVDGLSRSDADKLVWLFGRARKIDKVPIKGFFVGPPAEMVSPWSTNAVEITHNMGIKGVKRIERFFQVESENATYDAMVYRMYNRLDQGTFKVAMQRERLIYIENIAAYNTQEGLALNQNEVAYLNDLSKRVGRKLTDAEVFGFSQINSEHCRHKIFNGIFIIDGQEKPHSLFELIKKTSEKNPNGIMSAYKDNVAFIRSSKIEQFAPKTHQAPDYYQTKDINAVISLKAETHNFPTTVEPFSGAATGSGGEIRDRLAGGKGSLPLAGTAVYMTPYSRVKRGKQWEQNSKPRQWIYQTPIDILIKASNGASDFGNKFGQPLISGSLLTFEHNERGKSYGFDKVIMLAGGVGFGKEEESQKGQPEAGDKIVILGGDNYRIGMGGGAVSSLDTGQMGKKIELNAIQRSNPEMQKRVSNVIRAMVEQTHNPIVSVHDHGAGGHLNCLSELVEDTGGNVDLDKLPVGDKTLSAKEIIGNESQERMGIIVKEEDIDILKQISNRERTPMFVVGEVTNDHNFKFESKTTGEKPIDLKLEDMFGNTPKTVIEDRNIEYNYTPIEYVPSKITDYIGQVLQLEAVACKDWLTNKVDRCVTGKVAKQQNTGLLQLPLNDVGVMALDYRGKKGVATAIGHSPISALIDPPAGSKNSIAEALTNLMWAPITNDIKGVSLSANWMWPCKNKGEDARLYKAVEGASNFACELGINIPTGKDSLSMTQKYKDEVVYAPGTVIISAVAECCDIKKVVEPTLIDSPNNVILYINLSNDDYQLGGSSFAQVIGRIGNQAPTIKNARKFASVFNGVQQLIKQDKIVAGHDISSGGIITTLLEMCFAKNDVGASIDLSELNENDSVKLLFSENSGIVFQTTDKETVEKILNQNDINYTIIGSGNSTGVLSIKNGSQNFECDITTYRDLWYETSHLLDKKQSGNTKANERYRNYKNQPLQFTFPKHFTGKLKDLGLDPDRKEPTGIKAAIIREKGSNSEREMAYAMYLAGFDVKDVHTSDLMSGKEDLTDINFIAAVGGFSNSDVLGSAKGWAGALKYNANAHKALLNFFSRKDTLSLGVCNGCQLFIELDLITPEHTKKPKMLHNDSRKFECGFVSVDIPENNSIMLRTLAHAQLGIWVAHSEGKFYLPHHNRQKYNIVGRYTYKGYPGNPNGSDYNAMAMASQNGRHLVMMPHLERSIFSWNWAYYPSNRKNDEITPWIEAFVNAQKWIKNLNP